MTTSRDRPLSLVHLRGEYDGTTVEAVVSPDRGANVLGLSVQRTDWRWPVPILERLDLATVAGRPTSYGIPILGPTPGRVGKNQNGQFSYEGAEWRVEPTRHGFLRDLPWTIEERGPSHLICTVDVRPDAGAPDEIFPFEFRATYEIRLHSCGMRGRLSLENTSDRPQPLSAGFHPYLHCDRLAGFALVTIPARGQWELDEHDEPTPTGTVLPVTHANDFRDARPLGPREHWDHIFTDLTGGENGWVTAWVEAQEWAWSPTPKPIGEPVPIRTKRYLRLPLETTGPDAPRSIPHLQLYTPPGRNAVCLEPLATPPDALNLAHVPAARVQPLQPQERADFEFELGLEIL